MYVGPVDFVDRLGTLKPDGQVVNVANRVCALAKDGQLFISSDARRDVGQIPHYEFRSLGPQPLKGISERQEIFQVVPAGLEPAKPAEPASGTVVESSGSLIMLGEHFVEAEGVARGENESLTVTVIARSPVLDAYLRSLRSDTFGRYPSVPIAFHNEGHTLQVAKLSSQFRGADQTWTVAGQIVAPDTSMEFGFQDGRGRRYSAEDLVRLRAERLLLGKSPPRDAAGGLDIGGNFLEAVLKNQSGASDLSRPVLPPLRRSKPDDGEFLRCGRLRLLWALGASGICTQVHRLALGPLNEKGVRVQFSGLRVRNGGSQVLEVEGNCPL